MYLILLAIVLSYCQQEGKGQGFSASTDFKRAGEGTPLAPVPGSFRRRSLKQTQNWHALLTNRTLLRQYRLRQEAAKRKSSKLQSGFIGGVQFSSLPESQKSFISGPGDRRNGRQFPKTRYPYLANRKDGLPFQSRIKDDIQSIKTGQAGIGSDLDRGQLRRNSDATGKSKLGIQRISKPNAYFGLKLVDSEGNVDNKKETLYGKANLFGKLPQQKPSEKVLTSGQANFRRHYYSKQINDNPTNRGIQPGIIHPGSSTYSQNKGREGFKTSVEETIITQRRVTARQKNGPGDSTLSKPAIRFPQKLQSNWKTDQHRGLVKTNLEFNPIALQGDRKPLKSLPKQSGTQETHFGKNYDGIPLVREYAQIQSRGNTRKAQEPSGFGRQDGKPKLLGRRNPFQKPQRTYSGSQTAVKQRRFVGSQSRVRGLTTGQKPSWLSQGQARSGFRERGRPVGAALGARRQISNPLLQSRRTYSQFSGVRRDFATVGRPQGNYQRHARLGPSRFRPQKGQFGLRRSSPQSFQSSFRDRTVPFKPQGRAGQPLLGQGYGETRSQSGSLPLRPQFPVGSRIPINFRKQTGTGVLPQVSPFGGTLGQTRSLVGTPQQGVTFRPQGSGPVYPGGRSLNPGGGLPYQGIRPLNPGFGPVNQGVGPVNPGFGRVNPGVGSLNPGVGSLNPGIGQVNPGVGPVNPGIGPVNPGVGPVFPGTRSQGRGFPSQGGQFIGRVPQGGIRRQGPQNPILGRQSVQGTFPGHSGLRRTQVGQGVTRGANPLSQGSGTQGPWNQGVQPVNTLFRSLVYNRHNIFLKYLQNVSLIGMLQGGGPYTVFAPSDDAFRKADKRKMDKFLSSKELLWILISNHIVPGRFFSSTFKDGQVLQSLIGDRVYVNAVKEGPKKSTVWIHGSKVTGFDAPSTNGIVHRVDEIILPALDTLKDSLKKSRDHTIIYKALSETKQYIPPTLTFLAPLDSAFNFLQKDLKERLLGSKDSLKRLIAYHIIPRPFCRGRIFHRPGLSNMSSLLGPEYPLDIYKDPFMKDTNFVNNAGILGHTPIYEGWILSLGEVLLPDHQLTVDVLAEELQASQFVTLLRRSGLIEKLKQTYHTYTLFAPSNKAYKLLSYEEKRQLRTNTTYLKFAMSYHYTTAKVVSSNLRQVESFDTGLSVERPPSMGVRIVTNKIQEDIIVQGALIESADNVAKNGIVHVIDKFLLPPRRTLYDIIMTDRRLTYLKRTFQRSGILQELQTRNQYTIFAPNDNAFVNLLYYKRDFFRGPRTTFQDFLYQHMCKGVIFTRALKKRKPILLRTLKAGVNQRIVRNGPYPEHLEVHRFSARGTRINLMATNGIIHVVNRVLINRYASKKS